MKLVPVRKLSEHTKAARRIYTGLQLGKMNLKRARAEYQETFNMPVNDSRIDAEFTRLLDCSFNIVGTHSSPNVVLPAHIALAYFLREGVGRKKGPQSKSVWQLYDEQEELSKAWELKRNLMRDTPKLSAADAAEKAAKEIAKQPGARLTYRAILGALLDGHRSRRLGVLVDPYACFL